jgi:GMP synthase-like glutamine amidotransferase
MRVVVIRHHEEDSAGFIGQAFEARGAELSSCLIPKDDLPALDGVDHVVVLGAVWAVYDDSPDRAWIADELAWLRRADEAGVPVLGICFGGQALAAALGGGVQPAARKEIGWSVIDSVDEDVIPPGPWLEFHQDQFFPPPGARVLARSEVGVQAFSLGRHLGVQFHPEPDGALLAKWLDAGGRAEAEREGTDPDRFLAETYAQEDAARRRADALVGAALRIAGQAGVSRLRASG